MTSTEPDGEAPGKDPAPSTTRMLGHVGAMDGLRGVAWALVFVDHSSLVPGLKFGQVAMYVFLTLSGFLITGQLLAERARRGHVKLRAFYRRRACRLLPALVLLLAVWLTVVASFPHAAWMTSVPGGGPGGPEPFGTAIGGVTSTLGYLTNWTVIYHLVPGYLPLGHLWSLTVQEQFYLLWVPCLVLLLRRPRFVVPVAALLVMASLVEALVLLHQPDHWIRVYMGSDTRASSMLVGSVLAIWWSGGKLSTVGRMRAGWAPLAGSAVALLWAAWALAGSTRSLEESIAWVVATAAGAIFVLWVLERPGSAISRALSTPFAVYLGSRSYALYLWHYVWLTWFRSLHDVGVLLALAASFVSAELSWRLVERRAMRWGRRPSARVLPTPPAPLPGPGRRESSPRAVPEALSQVPT